jgi:hypothetical protein
MDKLPFFGTRNTKRVGGFVPVREQRRRLDILCQRRTSKPRYRQLLLRIRSSAASLDHRLEQPWSVFALCIHRAHDVERVPFGGRTEQRLRVLPTAVLPSISEPAAEPAAAAPAAAESAAAAAAASAAAAPAVSATTAPAAASIEFLCVLPWDIHRIHMGLLLRGVHLQPEHSMQEPVCIPGIAVWSKRPRRWDVS